MPSPVLVGLAQRSPIPLEDPLPAFRDDVLATLAAHPGIQVLAYPELHLNGSEHLPADARVSALESAAVALDSPFVAELGAIAREAGVWMCPGSIGTTGPDGQFFNTQLIFDDAGDLRACYHKMFPWRPHEPHQPGTEFVVTALGDLGPVGLSICYDAWFPEHSRQLAWLGAECVINIVKTTTPDREQELVIARANAIVNQIHMLSVNCAAPVGRGRSIAVDPEGWTLAEAGFDEETLVVPVDRMRVARVRTDGTAGVSRPWAQFGSEDAPVSLPMYDGRIDPAGWSPKPPPRHR